MPELLSSRYRCKGEIGGFAFAAPLSDIRAYLLLSLIASGPQQDHRQAEDLLCPSFLLCLQMNRKVFSERIFQLSEKRPLFKGIAAFCQLFRHRIAVHGDYSLFIDAMSFSSLEKVAYRLYHSHGISPLIEIHLYYS